MYNTRSQKRTFSLWLVKSISRHRGGPASKITSENATIEERWKEIDSTAMGFRSIVREYFDSPEACVPNLVRNTRTKLVIPH